MDAMLQKRRGGGLMLQIAEGFAGSGMKSSGVMR